MNMSFRFNPTGIRLFWLLSAGIALPKSVGVHGQMAARNAPTVLNAGLYFKAHWDGGFANVEEQAKKSRPENR
jgi:cytochrome c peroxidase